MEWEYVIDDCVETIEENIEPQELEEEVETEVIKEQEKYEEKKFKPTIHDSPPRVEPKKNTVKNDDHTYIKITLGIIATAAILWGVKKKN